MTNEVWHAGTGTNPSDERGCVYDETGFPVAYVCGQSEDDSDTRMIAAAPAMLAALKRALPSIARAAEMSPSGSEWDHVYETVNAAIARTEGH